jgi:hypothetical protein
MIGVSSLDLNLYQNEKTDQREGDAHCMAKGKKEKKIVRTMKLVTIGTYALTYHEKTEGTLPVLIGMVSCQIDNIKKVFGSIPKEITMEFKVNE